MMILKIAIAVVAMAAAYEAAVLDRDTQVAWGNHVVIYSSLAVQSDFYHFIALLLHERSFKHNHLPNLM